MNRDEILSQLRAAKAAHVSWVQRAKMLIEGFSINESSIPVNSTECEFGKWFYSEGQRLNDIRNNPISAMNEIEDLHFKLHDVYMNIFKIYYDTEKKGFFSKMFGKKKKVSDEDTVLAKKFFDEMEGVSKELVQALNTMERRINVVNGAEIDSI
ncbi:CZB domain-containing protein [Sulfurovum sp.]|uniref:CZB domain-containing protein n=1 Tax=Sulfurovum sp. TaxID=1969726 RepID=UPI002867E9C9|nr:CZB domain-containing protein [Sulfurovum sp.]